MVVSHHEVNNERPYKGRHILRRILTFAIHEGTQTLQAFGKLRGRRRNMEQLLLTFRPVDTNPAFPLPLEATSIVRIIERPLGHDSMNLTDKLWSELIRETRPHKFEGKKIVSNHPLRPRLRTPPFPEHLFCIAPRRGGSLHLGGGDRLLVQGIDEVPVSRSLCRNLPWELDLTSHLSGNVLIQAQKDIGQIEGQGCCILHGEGRRPGRGRARTAHCAPPRLASEPLGHWLGPEVILPRPILRIIKSTSYRANNRRTMILIHIPEAIENTVIEFSQTTGRRGRLLHDCSVHSYF